MTERTEIFTDGSYVNQKKNGGWSAVVFRSASGTQADTSNNEMELRAMVETLKMAEGPCMVIGDQQGLIQNAQQGKRPAWCSHLWDELYSAAVGKDV